MAAAREDAGAPPPPDPARAPRLRRPLPPTPPWGAREEGAIGEGASRAAVPPPPLPELRRQPLRLRRQRPAAVHLSSSPAAAASVGDEAGGGQLRAAMARARVAGAEPSRREARLRAAQACARLDPPPPCRAPVGEGGGGRDGRAAGHGREGLGP